MTDLIVGSKETRPEALATLRDNARQASTDKERGDRWIRSHGCVVSLPSKTTKEDYGSTVFLPADSARYVSPYKPDPAREMAFSRHATGANPRTVIALVNEVERLRAALTPPAEPVSRPAGEGEAVARLTRDVEAHPGNKSVCVFSDDLRTILALLRPAAPDGGGLADLAARVTAEVKRGADGSHVQALGALSNIEAMVRAAIPASEGGRG